MSCPQTAAAHSLRPQGQELHKAELERGLCVISGSPLLKQKTFLWLSRGQMVATDSERDQQGHCAVSTSLHTRPCLFICRDMGRGRGGLDMESHILGGRQVDERNEHSGHIVSPSCLLHAPLYPPRKPVTHKARTCNNSNLTPQHPSL